MDNRSSYRGCSLLATLLICFSVQTVLVISQESCMYEYIEQPAAENINCNPYGNRVVLRLQCALIAVLDSNVSINWYHNGTTQLTDVQQSSAENIDVLKETFRSILTVISPAPTNDSGDYHCQAVVDGNNLQPSDAFTLSGDPDVVIDFRILKDCDDSETDLFFASSTKCADVSPTEPVTTPTTPPPQPSQTTLPTTAPSLPTTVGGVAPTNSPGSTTENDITTANTQNNESSGATNVIPETLQVWIYVLVGVAAVFGIIIVILAIMCVGLCVRRSKTQDSHTLKRNAGGTIGTQSMVSNELYHSSDNFAAPSQPPPPNYQPYSTLGNREYETIGVFGIAQTDYAHLHRPSPPPLPATLPNGRLATINGTPPTPNSFKGSPPSLPPKGNIPDTHVYRELEDPLTYTPPLSANGFEQSTDQLLPSSNGPFSQANGGPYRKFSLESATASMNESLYSPTTPNFSVLTDIPETGMSFLEPNDPSAFPVHEYEVIPPSRKTKKYESPVPDERHMIPNGGHVIPDAGHVIGGKPQTRASVKSCNYETDPKMDLAAESGTTEAIVINPYDSTCRVNPYDSTTHIRTTSPLKNNSDYSDLRPPAVNNTMPPTHTNNSNYSKLHLTETESNYSRLQSRSTGTDNKTGSDFVKGASEISLSSTNPQNTANGGSVSSDCDHSVRETMPPHRRGCSVPLSPPPVYPQQGSYNQLTLPTQASRYPPHVGSKTLVQ